MSSDATFTPEQRERYRGHLSLSEIGPEGQEALRRSRVLIVGTGGLGSPSSLYLAAAGVGTLGLLDPDTVSLSNLQRQIVHSTPAIGRPKVESAAHLLGAVNPEVDLRLYPTRLTAENAAAIFSDYDVVLDCTDNLATRLLINDTACRLGKTLVFGAVWRTGGQIFTHVPGSPCYRCIFDAEAPEADIPCSQAGILNAAVGVAGSLQAAEAIKAITRSGALLAGRLLTFDLLTMEFNTFAVSPVNGCICQPR